jgi:hypothetical protein
MAWVLLAGVVVVLALRFIARRRRSRVVVLRSDPVSTIHGGLARKQSAKTRAALDAATAKLR